jgi:hypothetical protein
MSINLTPSAPPEHSDCFATLTQAAIALQQQAVKPPAAETVVAALLAAERLARHQRSSLSLAAISGRWRLSFVAPNPRKQRRGLSFGQGWYVPRLAAAHITFEPIESTDSATTAAAIEGGMITNQLQLGALQLQFAGFCRTEGKKNLVAFDFTQMQVRLFERRVWQLALRSDLTAIEFAQRSIAKLPFFTFFAVMDDLLAARGRGGGLAIWTRDPCPTTHYHNP